MYKFAEYVLLKESHYNVKTPDEVVEDVKIWLDRVEKRVKDNPWGFVRRAFGILEDIEVLKGRLDDFNGSGGATLFINLLVDLHNFQGLDQLTKEGRVIYHEWLTSTLSYHYPNKDLKNQFVLGWARPKLSSTNYINRRNYKNMKEVHPELKDVQIKAKLFEYIDKFEDKLKEIKSMDGWDLFNKLTKNVYDMHQWMIFLDFMEDNGMDTEEIRNWLKENFANNPPQEHKDDFWPSDLGTYKGWK